MNLFAFCVLYSLIPYLTADPTPNTIQIQNYDGPIFLHSPKPNCCPLCNSLLTPQKPALEHDNPCDSRIPEEYLRTTPPGTSDGIIPHTPFGPGPSNAYTLTSVNQFGTPGNSNSGTLLHTNMGKPGQTYPIPLTTNTFPAPIGNTAGTAGTTSGIDCPGTGDNAYKGTPCENNFNSGSGTVTPFCGTIQPTVTGTECSCTCVTKPLSSYLPINTSQNTCSLSTSSQNTCYNLPVVKNQVFGEEEQVLVPQKFTYSLVLDGQIAPTFNQNGPCDCRCYCYC